ncbi:MAG: GGDEF domain-containing protein [Gammaproteobacteria bacterium]|nr:GGDEF domain-containing protein [Gammaproteobacteria bacterium]
MDDKEATNLLISSSVPHPAIFTILGFFAGSIIWLIDAVIDSFILEPEHTLITSLFFAEGTELWMRLLIVFVMTMSGYFASRSFNKSVTLNKLLFKYQNELEELVSTRTQLLEEKTKQLEKLVNIDVLTNIYNRRKFKEVADYELNRFIRHQSPFSILMLDIDNFKKINDTYGHDVGDIVIKGIAQLIRDYIRNNDYFARWGGEEFIILSPETDQEGRCTLAKKIIDLIAEHTFEVVGKVTISIGLTSSVEGDTDIASIIKRADRGLYRAKDAGKNQYKVVD